MAGLLSDETPFFSVLVPVYNGAGTLRRCVDSVLRQTFSGLELVICDDGSADDSREIIRQYAAADCRVRLLEHAQNCGRSRTHYDLNRAARAPYSICVDADDEIAPDFLEIAAGILQRESWDMLNFPCELRLSGGRKLFNPLAPRQYTGENMLEIFLQNDAYQGAWWSKVFRTELLRRLTPLTLDDLQMDDCFFMVPLYYSMKSYRYVPTDHPMYIYYADTGQWSSTFYQATPQTFDKRCASYDRIYRCNLQFFHEHQLPESYDLALLKIYHLLEFFMILERNPDWLEEGIRIFRRYFLKNGNLLNDGTVKMPELAGYYEQQLQKLVPAKPAGWSFVAAPLTISLKS